MLSRIKALLGEMNSVVGRAPSDHGEDTLQVAAAALMVEAANLDGDFDENERQTIETLLRDHFGLDEPEARDLVAAAESAVDESVQLHGFTHVVKTNFSHEERVRMIEMLWEIAYADGRLHDYEANLVRRVAGLLYVTDRESGVARKKILARSD